MSPEQALQGVRECLADSLALEPDAIHPLSRLVDDLGADSLDFLDLLFGLEQRFQLKRRSMELDALLRAEFSEGKLVEKRYIPATEIERLAQWLPSLRAAPDPARVTPRQLYSYLTVESLVILVQRR